MKLSCLALALPLLATCASAIAQAPASPALAAKYGKLPLSFEANQGQADPHVKFLAHGTGYSLFLTDSAATLSLSKEIPKSGRTSETAGKADVLAMQLTGAAHAQVSGVVQLPGKANYFIGNDPSRWHTNLPTYARVQYTGVYPGVDLVYYGNQGQLEYDFVLASHASATPIRLHFAGAKSLALTHDGDLTVTAGHGRIAFHKPALYQVKDGQRQPIEGSFQLAANNTIGFRVGLYDHTRALVIDPTLAYSTYLGPSDGATGIAVSSSGDAFITGAVESNDDYPLSSTAYQKTITGYRNAFITKLNAAGNAIAYSTYLGGSAGDVANAIAVNSNGDAFITGYATSSDFPTTSGAYQTTNKNAGYGNNAFLAKIGTSGSTLLYSTYVGGTGFYNVDTGNQDGDQAMAVAVDSKGYAYIAGSTFSTDFPVTPSAYQQSNVAGSYDYSTGFISKFNLTGSELVYSTFLGGPQIAAVSGLAIDSAGDAFVIGTANDPAFPTTSGAFQPVSGTGAPHYGSTAFVTKLNPAGAALVYSTYLGGSFQEQGNAIAVNSAGNAFVTGGTGSSNFPVTSNAFQKKIGFVNGGNNFFIPNAFITEFNPAGTALVYSTYLGGSSFNSEDLESGDQGYGIALDTAGNIYVAGTASSSNFPVTANAFQSKNNDGQVAMGTNGFVSRLNTTPSTLLYSTYIGGRSNRFRNADNLTGIALDGSGNAYVAGYSGSTSYPVTLNAFQKTNTSAASAVVSKFAFNGPGTGTTINLTASTDPQAAGDSVTFTAKVAPASGSAIPTGTVSLSADGKVSTTLKLNANGSGTYTTSSLPSGTYSLVASYSGDSTFAPSSANLSELIYGPPATIYETAGFGSTVVYGSSIQFGLQVVDANYYPVPKDVVKFTGSGLSFPQASVMTDVNGDAIVTPKATATGNLTATATVSGISQPYQFPFTSTKAPLKVIATSVSVPQGQPIPALTYTITGFVNGDSTSVVSGIPGESTTATQGSPAGTYPITLTAGSLSATNYSFTLVNGTVTLTNP